MRNLFLAFLVLLLIGAATSTASGANTEHRCSELEQTCLCSEPLDFANAPDRDPFDPPDTEGSGAKECHNGPAIESNLGNLAMVTGSSMGLPGVGFVLRAPSGTTGKLTDVPNRDVTNKTWCERHYRFWETGYPNPFQPNGRVKGPRNQGQPKDDPVHPHPGFESAWAPWSPYVFSWQCQGSSGTPFGVCENNQESGNSITFADCKGAWCRFEHCFDHNSGTGVLGFRGRIAVLDGNESVSKQRTWTRNFVNTNPSLETGTNTNLASWYTQNLVGSGFSYVTHAMAAATNRDSGFWIGPAHEIEGGAPAIPAPTETEGVLLDGGIILN